MNDPQRTPAIRVLMMPRDTNHHGTIFGGVLINLHWGEAPVGLWVVAAGVIAIALLGRAVAGRVPECTPTDPDLDLHPFTSPDHVLRGIVPGFPDGQNRTSDVEQFVTEGKTQ